MLHECRRIAKAVGVKLRRRDTLRGPHWNGRTVALLNNGHLNTVSNHLHEIAHWLVATEEERGMVNFGLGASPDDMAYKSDWIAGPRINEAEVQASALGILMEKALGMDWLDTARMHYWQHQIQIEGKNPVSDREVFLRLLKAVAPSGYVVGSDAIPRKCPVAQVFG